MFSFCYLGILANGMEVAIKQLLIKTQQNIGEFLNEVVIIIGVKHQNLVKLKGCCLCVNKMLLVYEYLENGDLAKVLFDKLVNIDKYLNTLICFYIFFQSCIL
jgi:serine/threonine protein kinase